VQLDVYCDESRQALLTSKTPRSEYFLIGGLWVNRERRAEFNAAIRALLVVVPPNLSARGFSDTETTTSIDFDGFSGRFSPI